MRLICSSIVPENQVIRCRGSIREYPKLPDKDSNSMTVEFIPALMLYVEMQISILEDNVGMETGMEDSIL